MMQRHGLIHRREDWINATDFPPKWQRISQWKNNTIHYSLDLLTVCKAFYSSQIVFTYVISLDPSLQKHQVVYKTDISISHFTNEKWKQRKQTLASGLHQHDRISETDLAWKIRDRGRSRTSQVQSLDSLEVSIALKTLFFARVISQLLIFLCSYSDIQLSFWLILFLHKKKKRHRTPSHLPSIESHIFAKEA